MTTKEWIDSFRASSTLKRAYTLNAAFYDLYLHERISWEFGYYFESISHSRILVGKPIAEGDCPEYTETQWLIARYLDKNPDIKANFNYITVEVDGNKRQGIGIVITEQSRVEIANRIIYCIICENKNNKWEKLRII
jgi:hypothetical protein